jgi:hypothetical protein
MEIERTLLKQSTIEAFADEHGLVMDVHERRFDLGHARRFYAAFRHAEIKDGCILRGAYGDGATEQDAIAAYAREISMKRLVIDAYRPSRREIEVPRLYRVDPQ